MFKKKLAEMVFALTVTYCIGKWIVHMTYIERGYEAIGGEYCLILIIYWAAWNSINYLFKTLEDLENERNNRKIRSRRTARMRDY